MSRTITPQDEAERMQRLREVHGFAAFKFRVGMKAGRNGDAWPGRTPEIIRTLGTLFAADGVSLLADGNSCYDVAHALDVGGQMVDAGISQFEEPCPYWDYDATREVAAALPITISGGEQDNYLPAWEYMVATDVVDVCQPDVCYLGGVGRALQVARIAERRGKPIMFHAANSSMVTLFSLHVMAALRNAGPYCEFCIEPPEFHDISLRGLFEPELVVEDGAVRLGEQPGWGVRVSDRWLAGARYRVSELDDGGAMRISAGGIG